MSGSASRAAWPTDGLSFGGDYNPEQWPREVWLEDVALMREARVNLVTLGVFSWGLLEVDDGVFEWEWLDTIIDLLHANGIAVDLATPTASPPQWLLEQHPEILVVDEDGNRRPPGSRQGWCASSPAFAAHADRIVDAIARRYGDHPAVAMWHVGNELGGNNARCYCDASAAAFQTWLALKYDSIQALNDAWGTAVWGQTYRRFEQVQPPRGSGLVKNPSLVLDFDLFSSEALHRYFLRERDVLVRAGVGQPVTTNLMVNARAGVVDHAAWAPSLDIVANDHYTRQGDPRRAQDIAFSGDRVRGLAGRERPWLLMEHAAGAVSWETVNLAKQPGELIRHSLGHIARGSDGALFFQWRASAAGPEQFHSAMLPHAGTASATWRDIVVLGQHLHDLRPVSGTLLEAARVAILFDDKAGWAYEAGPKPTGAITYGDAARTWHDAFWQRNIRVDVVPPSAQLDTYDLVIVPGLYAVSDEDAERIAAVARRGGTVVVTALSGIVDPINRVRLGGYPGAFRELLGVHVDEFFPLLPGDSVALSAGGHGTLWAERVTVTAAEVHSRYAAGPLEGLPAVTCASDTAWYVSTELDEAALGRLVDQLCAARGLVPPAASPAGVEIVRRRSPDREFLFVLNHTGAPVWVDVEGIDLLIQTAVTPSTPLAAGGVRVVAREG
ncbi:beta-galactosidase [Leifsonia sp. TF02-11]|uniref:beta-galactosidase n=1 Tax=Leifsonia sp. TF02-11 TaxID=2815212 RepID=UPI001AA14480|nr:beta-galactosidase [Leifsonia sp. TF02-11]MBO1739313.1 beta-galactosidase [Leifsonia sp. TF02-11]